MTFLGKKRWTDDVHPHESPLLMTIPMMVLAVGSAFLGLILGPTNFISNWLNPVFGIEEAVEEHPVIAPMVITTVTLVLVAAGAALAWVRYVRDEVPRTAPAGSLITQAARKDLYQDAVNEGLLMRPGIHLTRALVFADSAGVDGAATVSAARRRGAPDDGGAAERVCPVVRPDDARRRRRHPRRRVGDAVMTSFPWLTVVGAIPLVGAVVVWLLPSGVAARAKQVALGFSLLTLVAGILATVALRVRTPPVSSGSTSSTSGSRSSGSATPSASTGSRSR